MADMMRNYRSGGFNPRAIAVNEMRPDNDARPQMQSCQKLKRKLQTVDFAIIETVLYLDAYPNCRAALDYYHKLVAERESLANAINEKCGPICHRGNKSRTEWNWVDGPWPWELDANS
ncbi:MAG: spore coat protein CotJB [Clostridia bacterium]|nr:spore coat protein CotJB [Clostridia bacterium]